MCESEVVAVKARKMFYEGLRALKAANLPEAARSYREGLEAWADVLTRHPFFGDDVQTKSEAAHTARRYLFALKQIGEKEPENYPFRDLVKAGPDDFSPDPFDQLEMQKTSATSRPAQRPK